MRQKIEKLFLLIKIHCGLFISLVVYLFLVSWNFIKQGVINFDEAYFAVVVRTFLSIIKTAVFQPAVLFGGNFFSQLADNYGNVYTAARPSYIIFSSLLGMFFPPEYAVRLTCLLAGGLALVYFYRLLGLYSLPRRIQSVGSLILALSPMFLLYSRIGLSQIFSAAFMVMAIFYLLRFWQLGNRKDIIKFALSFAVLFMSHYNVVLFCFILLCYACWAVWKKRSEKKDWFLFIFYLFVLPLSWEIITRVGSILANGRLSGDKAVFSYSQEFFNQLFNNYAGDDRPFEQIFYYFNLFFTTEGFSIVILTLLGLVFVLKRIKKFEYQAVFAPFLFTFLLFIGGQLKFPRNFVSILPVFYWLAIIGLFWLGLRLEKIVKSKIIVWVFLFGLVVLPHFWLYKSYLNINAGVRQTANYIRDNYQPQDTIILSWSAPLWRLYLPEFRSEQLADPEDWRPQLKSRPQILIIEDYFFDISGTERVYDIAEKKEVARFKTNIFSVRPVIMDFVYRKPEIMKKLFSNNKDSQTIVYQYRMDSE